MGLLFSNQLTQIAAVDETDRHQRMDRAWAAYYGRTPDQLKSKAGGQANDNVKPNKARVIVDKGVSFLFGDALTFKLVADSPDAEGAAEPGEDKPADPRQVWLDKCWLYNKQHTLLHKLALNGGVCGHAFVRVYAPQPGEAFPRVVALDPCIVGVQWDPKDVDCIRKVTIQYTAINPEDEKPYNYRTTITQQGQGWRVVDEVSQPDSNRWQPDGPAVAWNHPYPPILGCQNLPAPNEYWGISDIQDDVLALQAAAQFTLSNAQRIIRYHASPQTVAKGVGPQTQISRDVDGVVVLPSPDSDLRNLEMQHDLAATIQQYEHICEAIHEVTRIPAISTGTLDNLGQLSGVALQILYQPLLEKTLTKRRYYGELLVELCRILLDLGGFGADNEIAISWPEMLPSDPLQERQTYLLEDQMGVVSKETIAERLGLDWPTELARMAAEKARALADAQASAAAMAPPGQSTPIPGQAEPGAENSLPPVPKLGGRVIQGMKPEG